ncbi:MAG: Hemerythrin cation binding domain protein [Streptosporangiaceae bacterium]|nr:Hemerythrin cation binding domain protein [Streptosporangiaceae bacterium]
MRRINTELEMLPLDQRRRAPRLSQLLEVLRQDVRDEEDVLFPLLLQENLHPRRLPWLAASVSSLARWISPTRLHPRVARRPPGNAL